MRKMLPLLFALFAGLLLAVAAEAKAKGEPAPDGFDAALGDYVDYLFSKVTVEERAIIFPCLSRAFANVSAEDRASIVSVGFVNMTAGMNTALRSRYPEIGPAMEACVPLSVKQALRPVVLEVAGQGTSSMAFIDKGNWPKFPGGGVSYDGGVLTVAGRTVALPEFSRELRINVAEDGTVQFTVDPYSNSRFSISWRRRGSP